MERDTENKLHAGWRFRFLNAGAPLSRFPHTGCKLRSETQILQGNPEFAI
jgi:hypothetical protein